MRYVLAFTLGALMVAPVFAAPTVDGVKDAEYGDALSVQMVQTQFGDEGVDGTDVGGELDAAYATIAEGRLYLMITGNLQNNFNKLDIFIDSVPGGENTLSNTPQYDFMSGGGWISQNLGGLTFDTNFTADYHLFSRSGGGNYEVDFVDRLGGGNAMVPGASAGASTGGGPGAQTAMGSIPAGDLGPNASSSSLSSDLLFGFDNSNDAGVSGGTGAADVDAALAVSTGMEFSIALADLGNPAIGSTIKISALYNNGDHNFVSNQVLGPLTPPQSNLGGDGGGTFTGTLAGLDFNQFAGAQYFEVVVVPEPANMVLAGLAALGFATYVARRK